MIARTVSQYLLLPSGFCKTLSKQMLEYEKSIIIPKGIDQSDNKIVVEPVVKFIK